MSDLIEVRRALNELAEKGQPVDLHVGALRKARRIRARRTVATIVGVLVLVVALGGAAVALTNHRNAVVPAEPKQASCSMTMLSVPPGGRTGRISYIDPTGTWVVNGNVLWHIANADVSAAFQPRVLPVDATATAVAVNPNGVVIGSGAHGGWVYRDGKVTDLPLLAESVGNTARAIDAAGDIVGSASFTGGPNGNQDVAVIWPASNYAAVRPLPAPATGRYVEAVGISDNGTIIGEIDSGEALYLWPSPSRAGHKLANPRAEPPVFSAGINDRWALAAAGGQTLVGGNAFYRYNLRTGAVTVLPEQVGSNHMDNATDGSLIDLAGDVLAPGEAAPAHAGTNTVIRKGADVVLPIMTVRYGPLVSFSAATAISADGHLIAGSTPVMHENKPVLYPLLWYC